MTKYCEVCGKKFTGYGNSRFCGDACRKVRRRICQRRYNARKPKAQPRELICKKCGLPFLGMWGAKYCIPCLQNGDATLHRYLSTRIRNTEYQGVERDENAD